MALLLGCNKSSELSPSSSKTNIASATPLLTKTVWFEEIGEKAGLTFIHRTGHQQKHLMPEINTGGIGVLDFDQDGLMDIICVQGGSLYQPSSHAGGHKLFKNLGAWKFQDFTDQAGLRSERTGYGMGVACADYDNDGDTDIFITQMSSNLLYRNDGRGKFQEVGLQSGVAGSGWSSSAAWVDYNRDGLLDLFVARYLEWRLESEVECFSRGGRPDYCSPLNYQAPAKGLLFRNKGDGNFEDVSEQSGISARVGTGLGVAVADFNKDGWHDIYVANDAMPNHLWINQRNGHFQEEAMLRGCAVNAIGLSEAGMGVVAVDLLERGQWDLYITHLANEFNRFYSSSNGWFTDLVHPQGPAQGSWPMTGWGTTFADFDNDGWIDLYNANGRVKFGPSDLSPTDVYAEPNQLLRGIGLGSFKPVDPVDATAPSLLASSRALASADFDNDGMLDLVVANRDNRPHLLRNIAPKKGNWIAFKILTKNGADAIGSVLTLLSVGRTRMKQIQPNEGYCSSHDPRIHFGLGESVGIEKVIVQWPNGSIEEHGPLPANQIHTIRQK